VEYTGPNSIDFGFLRNQRVVLWLSILGGVVLAVTVASVGWWLSSRK
jgi:hypothetical protein